MKSTHEVLDLVYTPDEGQECFVGTEQECYDFIAEQSEHSKGAMSTYKVVPIVRYEVYYPDGDLKCVVDSYEEAKKESKRFSSIDIRELLNGKEKENIE